MNRRKTFALILLASFARAEGQIHQLPSTVFATTSNSYSTEICNSVIAIADTPDFQYLEENGIDITQHVNGEDFVCEMNGDTVPIFGTEEQMEKLRILLNEGELISAETTIAVTNEEFMLTEDGINVGVVLPPGDIILKNGTRKRERNQMNGRSTKQRRRNLSAHVGEKQVLVVRVIDEEGKASDDAQTVSNKIFGTYGDEMTMKSQFEACSFGKLRISNNYNIDISNHLEAPGVIDVNVPLKLSESNRLQVRTASINAVEEKLGFELPGPFDH
ncbi:hypothetical protein ACHAXS_012553, partial [Conticribra weissflogii]